MEIKIKLIRADVNIADIAKMHVKAMPETTSSRIGSEYVEILYKALKSSNHIFLIARSKLGTVGVLTASQNLSLTQKILKNLTLKTIFLLLKAAALGKVDIRQVWSRLQFEDIVVKELKKPYIYILTLFVENSHQRQGIGRQLLDKVIKKARAKPARSIYLDTYINNKDSLAFYKAAGFTVVKKINEYALLKYTNVISAKAGIQ